MVAEYLNYICGYLVYFIYKISTKLIFTYNRNISIKIELRKKLEIIANSRSLFYKIQ